MHTRHPFYAKAHHYINVIDLDMDALIKKLDL